MTPHSLTVSDTCRRYGIGKTTLYQLIAAKKVKAVKLGSRTLVLAASVEQHLATLSPPTDRQPKTAITAK